MAVGARMGVLLLCFVDISLYTPFSTLVPNKMIVVYGHPFPTQRLSPSESTHSAAMPCITYLHGRTLQRDPLQVENFGLEWQKHGRLLNFVFPRLIL